MEEKIKEYNGNEVVTLLKLEESNREDFIEILEKHLHNNFTNGLHENYGREKPWSLLNLIESEQIDSYILIYVDGNFWGATGGIFREYNGEKIYQAGFRVFTNTRRVHKSLGSKSYIHEYGTKYHITRAKKNHCAKVILSFNNYNERFYKLTRDYHLPKVFGTNVWKFEKEMKLFNGVNQWLLTMYL